MKEVAYMSCIVYQTNKKTGVKYAYESISYWDKEKQQPRSKRKYIGRVDPITGEIIRKDEKDNSAERNTDTVSDELKELYAKLKEKDSVIAKLTRELSDSRKAYDALADKVRSVRITVAKELSDV